MKVDNTPNPDEYKWKFEQHDSVGVWDLRGWGGWADRQLESVSEHYRQRASEDDISATLAIFGEKTSLPSETQEYMASEWSENGEYVDVDKIGFVAEGITGMAVRSKLQVSAETADFDTLDAGLAWARD
jgi:hypothetical protein